MKRKVIKTADGSTTIQIEEWGEQYHSLHGALQEAYHVFISHGLDQIRKREISILEVGFGTGLNALISLIEARKKGIAIRYTGVEKFPVAPEEISQLNYLEMLGAEKDAKSFERMHKATWEEANPIESGFVLEKQQKDFREIEDIDMYELVYFDAFGARVQPELWTEAIFVKMFKALKAEGILVTYAAKGSVRRAMESAGFRVERLPGPPGKREMLRAIKP
ncbi:tRNA (5-methylaminomethyl-2-thiouridine)(34)-methyltransferase MnmD [Poritiphilus flavus]|uniref:tRNA (5-methylaminomethyl-2-thiouridine)(34)-methyltransferase MnmD n=1 Tax=Poritiphilus flavus TaxID=2697053 RepID=A0A6L9E9H2_9FLAO|nr:tRNA (5-methylaminomethyl-2-thiouridine)(34)-methyltransferase MnmD [Poritiphilus flavus]NAS11198.1 tRNA (5-methylaminomethyl-2-thiouridine)(34)-methyltransferase MnmD [Poritiphilus flavus]